MEATQRIFKRKNLPFRSFEILNRNEEVLGELFTFFILETILLGKFLNLNPYDQPAVEMIKKNTKKRPDRPFRRCLAGKDRRRRVNPLRLDHRLHAQLIWLCLCCKQTSIICPQNPLRLTKKFVKSPFLLMNCYSSASYGCACVSVGQISTAWTHRPLSPEHTYSAL